MQYVLSQEGHASCLQEFWNLCPYLFTCVSSGDFVTDLPSSQGCTAILVSIDLLRDVSDRRTQFTSFLSWGEFYGQLGINICLTSGYYPQSKGQAEHVNQELGRYLSREHHGIEFIPWAECAQNSLTHSSTDLTQL